MISVSHVSKYYGENKAVSDVSVEVREGENFILLGTSGCGKTTTLRMINRLIEPSSGKILVNGRDVKEQSPEQLRRGIGYVLQRTGLFPHYTIYENIAVVPSLLRWSKQKTAGRIHELVNKLRLSDRHLSLYPHQLSGGEAQRVNLARAMVVNPAVMLMDEPFGALDPVTRIAIRQEFSNLDEFRNKTILMVTHDVQEAFELGDHICLMDGGQIMQTGTPRELLFHPANEFVSRFLAGSHLQLSLMITRLHDLVPFLEDGRQNEYNEGVEISAETSLWKAMEMLTARQGDGYIVVRDERTRQMKTAGMESLLTGFSRYKNQL